MRCGSLPSVSAGVRQRRRAPGHPARPVSELRRGLHRRPPYTAFIAMAAVVLAITGAEALYADLGHFGRAADPPGLVLIVFPALTLNYLAQGALILRDPAARGEPLLPALPHWAQFPMVILATMATVIASQAVISGAFTVSRQAVRLGFLPHMTRCGTPREQRDRPGLRARGELGTVRGRAGVARLRAPRNGSRRPTASRSPARSSSRPCCCCRWRASVELAALADRRVAIVFGLLELTSSSPT